MLRPLKPFSHSCIKKIGVNSQKRAIFATGSGEMPEWLNGPDSKSGVLLTRDRGFESLSLRSKQFHNGKHWEPVLITKAGFTFLFQIRGKQITFFP